MFTMRSFTCLLLFLTVMAGLLSHPAHAGAEENHQAHTAPLLSCVEPVWCDIAQQIGGPALRTRSLITSEGMDPHHLQPSPLMARQLAASDAVLLNGATYDDWAVKLLPASIKLFLAADYAGWLSGTDPHLFFDLPTVRKTAQQVAAWLSDTVPQARQDIDERLARFEEQIDQIARRLDVIDQTDHGAPFAMTEPAGERLLLAAGLDMTDQSWARALMNESGLSPYDTAMLETAIKQKTIRFLVRNPAIDAPQAHAMEELARQAGLPVISIGESLPAGLHWQDWLNQRLTALENALKQTAPHGTGTP
ncbi:zinc ABC transporter substrate-binding protein [Bombella sp. TMW 2.2559]|uniref:Zinc ABC transporter substrate-binding protein n=1 Tax=Bombella dulcis TaxID=2967339 RepID=A0ABT3WCM7_9PROT|nr:zinc ABC transporter substrate-binding protein [Bombella dulcis]MCX5616443.1 zinc ABC transporter substrate-binding protein [Bombella dulcis]